MNKILINLYIPSLDENYNLFIPINKKVGTIKNTIISTTKNLVEGNYKLVLLESGAIVDDNVYVKNSGIVNGSRLILI